MAVGGCHKEYVEVCEIFVYAPRPAPANASRYTRLRFGLLASSWLPNPLGIALWKALHVVMLVVGGPAFGALALLATFLFFDVCCLPVVTIGIGIWYAFVAMVAVAMDLVLLVVRLMRYTHIEDWRGHYWRTPGLWEFIIQDRCVAEFFEDLFSIGVPCMRRSCYRENKDRMWESWARWWKEVVHAQQAVVL